MDLAHRVTPIQVKIAVGRILYLVPDHRDENNVDKKYDSGKNGRHESDTKCNERGKARGSVSPSPEDEKGD